MLDAVDWPYDIVEAYDRNETTDGNGQWFAFDNLYNVGGKGRGEKPSHNNTQGRFPVLNVDKKHENNRRTDGNEKFRNIHASDYALRSDVFIDKIAGNNRSPSPSANCIKGPPCKGKYSDAFYLFSRFLFGNILQILNKFLSKVFW